MRIGEAGRAFALALLLTAGALAGLAPPAAAQEAPFLCFEGETAGGLSQDIGNCSVGLYAQANFLQGDTIRIKIQNVEGSSPYVRVRCIDNCNEVAGNKYYARWDGRTLRFPYDFNADRGPDGDGNLSLVDKVPRYNSTWEAALLLSENEQANPKRTFGVWLMSLYKSENLTIHPGETHHIRSSGLDPRTPLDLKIERRNASAGRYDIVQHHNLTVPPDGVLRFDWSIPKDEARRIAACGERTWDCYRLVVRGVGKTNEALTFGAAPATIDVRPVLVPQASSDGFIHMERTQEIRLVHSINYPGGANAEGPKLAPEDIRASFTNPQRGLRVLVEEIDRSTGETILRNETRMHYSIHRFAWELVWTIPRDLTLNQTGINGPEGHYRIRLAGESDQYGNRVPPRVLGNFTFRPAVLDPVLVEPIDALGRTEPGEFRFRIEYHNGSVLGIAENETGIRGCVIRDLAPLRSDCPPGESRVASYHNGTWSIGKRFPRDYAHVNGDGAHRLLLVDGIQDAWGNRVDARPEDSGRAYLSDTFLVVPTSPRITFTTVQRGVETDNLVRGYPVTVQAVIKYADGSPFNHTVLENETRTLNITLARRGTNGAIQSEELLVLRETDVRAGRWMGSLPLTRDDTVSPIGRWSFTFDIADNLTVPNTNLTAFERNVTAALIQLSPTFQPSASIPTGSLMRFRFKLFFEDGRAVPPTTVAGALEARVYPFDRAANAPVGEPVSGLLEPLQVAGSDGEFSVDWEIPSRLFAGEYVVIVRGGDIYGNKLAETSSSRSFRTFADTRERSTLVQPPASVKRGESATVVFDGQDGDVGGPGAGVPAVRLERWDVGTNQWVLERQTTRISDPTTFDHIGVFPVTTNTVIGVYRFRLEGRDATLNGIHGVSGNFTVEPTVVQRAIVEPPPEVVVKGVPIQFGYERLDGDRLTQATILLNGRPAQMQAPSVSAVKDHVNVTFIVPYEATSGNYSVRIVGRDMYGNAIEVVSPPVEVNPASLLGKIIGNPSRVIERGEEAKLLFGITNPDGGFYMTADVPLVEVHNATGPIATADVVRDGLAFAATWTPDERMPEDQYHFVVSGTGTGGNVFPTLHSELFRVTPGILTRDTIADVSTENIRGGTITFAVGFEPDDEFVAFKLGYFGPSYDVAPALFETRDPATLTTLPHTIDVESGRYVARFVTDHTTSLGAYRIYMEGRDSLGNDIVAKSGVFLLSPTSIIITWDSPAPSDDTFGEGKTYRHSFVARYRDGTIMTDDYGRPSVALLYDDLLGTGRKPVSQRPEVVWENDRWVITWTGPEIMPDGAYTFSVGGSDSAGNPIGTLTSGDIILQRGTGDSAGIFLKELPAPSPPLVLLALGGIALLVARRRHR